MMTRQQLWNLCREHGLTQSTLLKCPTDDNGLKIVICNAPVSSKKLIDFFCALDGSSK